MYVTSKNTELKLALHGASRAYPPWGKNFTSLSGIRDKENLIK